MEAQQQKRRNSGVSAGVAISRFAGRNQALTQGRGRVQPGEKLMADG